MKKVKRKRRFLKPKPEWLMRRLLKKKIYSVDDVSILLGNHIKNIYELMRRGRLKPISNKLPYRFSPLVVRDFVRQRPGPKPKPKVKTKRFIPKLKSKGGDLNVEKRIS